MLPVFRPLLPDLAHASAAVYLPSWLPVHAHVIREDRHLRQALREMYSDADDSEVNSSDYQPEAETVALFNEIRRELEARPAGVGPGRIRPSLGDTS